MPPEWTRGRRPITIEERTFLVTFGNELRRLRQDADLSRSRLARHAILSPEHIAKLELGYRRPRRSTLGRIAAAMVDAEPSFGAVGDIVSHLCELAGPALAPESQYAREVERTVRRRRRRWDLDDAWFAAAYERRLAGACAEPGEQNR